MVNSFLWNSLDLVLELNKPELFLIKEFKVLLERDDTPDKKRAFQEFTYIYLMIDWRSPYADYIDIERHDSALDDSELTEELFNDPLFKAACKKYQDILENDIKIQAVNSALYMVHRIIDYFENLVDFEKTNEQGTPIYKVKDVMQEMSNLSKVLDELDNLKQRVKKDLGAESGIRGGHEDGFMPDF